MKSSSLLSISAVLVIGILAAWVASADGQAVRGEAESTVSTFHVTGMTCGGCEVGVRRIVNKLDGVEKVEASHKKGTATVTYRAEELTPDDIIAAIEELGYTAELASDDKEGA